MSILSDGTLHEMLHLLVEPADHNLVNPASIDIRVGVKAMYQAAPKYGKPPEWEEHGLLEKGIKVYPGELVLIETYEILHVPNGYAMDLRLKSTAAREGWNHSLAFWFDPGWHGIGTMELQNISEGVLILEYGRRIAQIIVHELDKPALKPYTGKYQHATGVELAKPEAT